jgi:hypothetical protein
MCAIVSKGLKFRRFSHVFKADQYCGVDQYYCNLPNGTEVYCIPGNSSADPGNAYSILHHI